MSFHLWEVSIRSRLQNCVVTHNSKEETHHLNVINGSPHFIPISPHNPTPTSSRPPFPFLSLSSHKPNPPCYLHSMGKRCKHMECNNHTNWTYKKQNWNEALDVGFSIWIPYERRRRTKKVLHGVKYLHEHSIRHALESSNWMDVNWMATGL
jgi:hypothetical protein